VAQISLATADLGQDGLGHVDGNGSWALSRCVLRRFGMSIEV
jgi:hypothetical protein